VTIVAGGGAKAVDMHETTMQGFIEILQPAIEAAAA
jgi:FMN-dependent NADH-azoreductase